MIRNWWLIRGIVLQGEIERLRFCIKVNRRGLFEIELWFDDLDIIVDDFWDKGVLRFSWLLGLLILILMNRS